MPYTVHSEQDRKRMLETIGASSADDLFVQIPEALRKTPLRLAPGLSEQETRARTDVLAAADRPAGPASFLGAGYYRHFVPAAVRALVSRSEFATAYTPYQPEVSQGTLEHIFEFQTCICEITGMDVANASLYDGPSALAEGAFMALRASRRNEMAVSAGVHPEARLVLATYTSGPAIALRVLPLHPGTGATVRPKRGELPSGVGAVLVQQPNHLGVIEDLEPLAAAAHANGALLVVSVNPATLGLLESPGALGADIVVGDAQVFGCPPSFGGPSVGFLACQKEHVRQIPGRLVSQTVDEDGRVCYTLTMQAREQHVRRARATSNICSNQALSALAATIHLALLGPAGLRDRGEICLRRAHFLRSRLCALPGVRPLVDGPFFNEFALRLPCRAEDFARAMRAHGVDPGVPLTRLWQGQSVDVDGGADEMPVEEALLVAVTELNPPEALARYVESAASVLASLEAVPESAARASALDGAAPDAGRPGEG
jgi:glycine cleavage system P protein (glycine dehydrogenase) subunit 1